MRDSDKEYAARYLSSMGGFLRVPIVWWTTGWPDLGHPGAIEEVWAKDVMVDAGIAEIDFNAQTIRVPIDHPLTFNHIRQLWQYIVTYGEVWGCG